MMRAYRNARAAKSYSRVGYLMTQLPEATAQEIQLYAHVVLALLGLWAVILVAHLTLAAVVLLNQFIREKNHDIDLFNAGRELEVWLRASANRSASIRRKGNSEWTVVLRDPDLYMAGASSLTLNTSIDRPLALAVREGLLQAKAVEASPPV